MPQLNKYKIINSDDEYVLTNMDLMGLLRKHIKFLITSARLYDEGDKDEVLRMAGSIRTLCKDRGNTQSLLTQLGKKDMLFYDTFINVDRKRYYFDGENVHINPSQIGSHYFDMGTGELYAPLDNVPPALKNNKVDFGDWWDKLIFIDMNGNGLTRGELILSMCDKEFAHVDTNVDRNYSALSKFNTVGLFRKRNGNYEKVTGVENPLLRQITHEILKSLADEFPDISIISDSPKKRKRNTSGYVIGGMKLIGKKAD